MDPADIFDRLAGWLLCKLGHHDLHPACEGMELAGPPKGHPCEPLPDDSQEEVFRKFGEWTSLHCSRCDFTFPAAFEKTGGA